METILNSYNTTIQQGTVTKFDQENSRFYLRNRDISIPVFCRDVSILSVTEGDFVNVYGRLRYSHQTKKYKVIAAKLDNSGKLKIENPLNFIMLEGYAKNIVMLDNVLSLEFGSINLTKPNAQGESEGFELPILVKFVGGKAIKAQELLNDTEPFLLEGSLHGKPETYILGSHIIPATKIVR